MAQQKNAKGETVRTDTPEFGCTTITPEQPKAAPPAKARPGDTAGADSDEGVE